MFLHFASFTHVKFEYEGLIDENQAPQKPNCKKIGMGCGNNNILVCILKKHLLAEGGTRE